ncbi:hypothetical protein D5086_016119 [Populus alba]|uniref:Uncharacterized protein n=1 Tax=Populus alba TaxID=43335 RepID=A0ACC4BTA0_POPAL
MVLQATAYIAYGSIQQLASYYKMLTLTANSSETHPWHLHRHDFWALGVYPAQDQGIFIINHTKNVMKQIVLQLPLDEGDHTSSALNSMASTNDAEATGEENSRVGADDDEETEDVSALNTNRED